MGDKDYDNRRSRFAHPGSILVNEPHLAPVESRSALVVSTYELDNDIIGQRNSIISGQQYDTGVTQTGTDSYTYGNQPETPHRATAEGDR